MNGQRELGLVSCVPPDNKRNRDSAKALRSNHSEETLKVTLGQFVDFSK